MCYMNDIDDRWVYILLHLILRTWGHKGILMYNIDIRSRLVMMTSL